MSDFDRPLSWDDDEQATEMVLRQFFGAWGVACEQRARAGTLREMLEKFRSGKVVLILSSKGLEVAYPGGGASSSN